MGLIVTAHSIFVIRLNFPFFLFFFFSFTKHSISLGGKFE